MFQFYKRAVTKQRRMRDLIYGFIWETNEQMYKGRTGPQGRVKSIINFVQPYSERRKFCPKSNELPDNYTFDMLTFFRFFKNPNLSNFSSTSLHQYHILFNLLESELRFMQTEM